MSLNFGKLDFAVSFNPLTAFPLDSRSYFESYDLAVAAAAQAVPAGSTDGLYYYGQPLVVVENNKANFYVIQPDKTLSLVLDENETALDIDASQFEHNADGTLSLKGYSAAEIGSFFTKGENGLIWTKPVDAYSKEETDAKIAAAAHLKRKIVTSITEIEEYMASHLDADQYIFMVPTGLTTDSDRYDEYMVIIVTDSDGIETKLIEKVGSWEVNLNDYATKEELKGKVDKQENARLITTQEAEKLEGLEKSLIQSVDETSFGVDATGKLSLKDLPVNKIIDLENRLNGKIDSQEGYSLVSPTDRQKLDALVIGDSGGLEISGTVNASNVQGLDEWVTSKAGTVKGLSENNLTDELHQKLSDSLSIKSIDTNEMNLSAEGQLSITAVDSSKVTGLSDILAAKASVESVNTLSTAVTNLETSINQQISNINSSLTEIDKRLTWQDL